MYFTELRFIAFFAIVWAIHWGLRSHGARKTWLLAASYAFYAGWDWRFLGLIVLSTVVDYAAGLMLGSERVSVAGRRAWLIASLAVNLGVLGLFKYFDFFVDSAAGLLTALGFQANQLTLELVLPVGISFYTFQTLSYTIDVYRGKLETCRNPRDFALFVAFFPQLVAGPIVRAADFLPQLKTQRRWNEPEYRALAYLFLAGFIKKACVADNLARFVDEVYSDPSRHDALTLAIGSFATYVQVYCDFSGYTDMALAAAGMLGYGLCINFDFPIFARSVTRFWGRWHISLGSWFRDYLYIPLGGSRHGEWRTRFNLLAVFLLCGLWHGANWTFIAFGGYVGLLLVVERLGAVRGWIERTPLGVLYNWAAIGVAMIYFRSSDIGAAHAYLTGVVAPAAEAARQVELWPWLTVLGVFLAAHWVCYRRIGFAAFERLPTWSRDLAFGAAIALALPWTAPTYQPFIYFQF